MTGAEDQCQLSLTTIYLVLATLNETDTSCCKVMNIVRLTGVN